MARRVLAGLLVAVALLAGSLAWWGLTLQRTVFDSSRSTQLARAMLDTGQVQDALVAAATKAVQGALPPDLRAQVPTAEVSTAARSALTDPAVTATLEKALVGTHRYLIGDSPTPPTLDPAPLDAALRRQLAAIDPKLATVVPTLPPLQIQLPDSGLPAVRGLRHQIARATGWTALVAVIGVALAFLVAKSRRSVLRRVGFWAVTTGGLWVALRYVLPALAEAVLPASAALVGGLAQAMAGGMATPGLLLAAGGAAILVASVVPVGSRAAMPADRRVPGRTAPRAAEAIRPGPGTGRTRPTPVVATGPGGGRQASADRQFDEANTRVLARPAGLGPPPGGAYGPATMQQKLSMTGPTAVVDGPPEPRRAGSTARPGPAGPASGSSSAVPGDGSGEVPRWVPGLGYVVDQAPPQGGRWVEGVGYVLD